VGGDENDFVTKDGTGPSGTGRRAIGSKFTTGAKGHASIITVAVSTSHAHHREIMPEGVNPSGSRPGTGSATLPRSRGLTPPGERSLLWWAWLFVFSFRTITDTVLILTIGPVSTKILVERNGEMKTRFHAVFVVECDMDENESPTDYAEDVSKILAGEAYEIVDVHHVEKRTEGR